MPAHARQAIPCRACPGRLPAHCANTPETWSGVGRGKPGSCLSCIFCLCGGSRAPPTATPSSAGADYPLSQPPALPPGQGFRKVGAAEPGGVCRKARESICLWLGGSSPTNLLEGHLVSRQHVGPHELGCCLQLGPSSMVAAWATSLHAAHRGLDRASRGSSPLQGPLSTPGLPGVTAS